MAKEQPRAVRGRRALGWGCLRAWGRGWVSITFHVAETGLTSVHEAQKTRIIVRPCWSSFHPVSGAAVGKIKGQVKKHGFRGAHIFTAWL